MNYKFIFLHEYGEPSHYSGALAAISKDVTNTVHFFEFSLLKTLLKGLISRDRVSVIKVFVNFKFLFLTFLFPSRIKNVTLILGAAPFDWRMLFLVRIIKHANVIYHSSWANWSGEHLPKRNKLFLRFIKAAWKDLFFKTRFFAVVTPMVKLEINKYMAVPKEKISIVYHSFDESIFYSNIVPLEQKVLESNIKLKVVYVGRLIEEKGVNEIIELAKMLPDIEFDIIGRGRMEDAVTLASANITNLVFTGFVSNRAELAKKFNESDILIQPSKKTDEWQELFGMAIVEAMACHVVPVTTLHSGPKCILEHSGLNKNMCNEDHLLAEFYEKLTNYDQQREVLEQDKKMAAELAKKYNRSSIANIWSDIFEKI